MVPSEKRLKWFNDTGAAPEAKQIAAAHGILCSGGSVGDAAARVGVSRRQLHRWFRQHLGIGPKDLADLERLHVSLQSVQTGGPDPIAGYSDQAHQIRNWRRRLGVTPGAYSREVRSPMAAFFSSERSITAPAFYL